MRKGGKFQRRACRVFAGAFKNEHLTPFIKHSTFFFVLDEARLYVHKQWPILTATRFNVQATIFRLASNKAKFEFNKKLRLRVFCFLGSHKNPRTNNTEAKIIIKKRAEMTSTSPLFYHITNTSTRSMAQLTLTHSLFAIPVSKCWEGWTIENSLLSWRLFAILIICTQRRQGNKHKKLTRDCFLRK